MQVIDGQMRAKLRQHSIYGCLNSSAFPSRSSINTIACIIRPNSFHLHSLFQIDLELALVHLRWTKQIFSEYGGKQNR